jgi:hypothetical protein
MDEALRSWVRVHKNGMAALVFERPNPGEFAAGAVPHNGSAPLGVVSGTLGGTQAWADNEAKCEPSYKCPPWPE